MPDYKTMQQEAIRRALDMQNRAQQSSLPPQTKESHDEAISHLVPETKKQDIFEILFKDSEKTLIVILILIFLSEDTDISLLIALIYLIL